MAIVKIYQRTGTGRRRLVSLIVSRPFPGIHRYMFLVSETDSRRDSVCDLIIHIEDGV